MSKKAAKKRTAANTTEVAAMSTNERILQDCHKLYTDEERGLVRMGSAVDLTILPPRKKITVLLIGNHSAGKSSFINWYIEEHVQKTGVAIETQGFTLITSGKRRETLAGNATFHQFPLFRELKSIDDGVERFLGTEIATSKQKCFHFVTFIDTPGLVDGDMMYPYDVDHCLDWLGDKADLILVFFDPLGQALCKRTLNVVECLNRKHPDRLHFFLSKADTAGTERDRHKVLVQVTQELCRRPGMSLTGLEIPTIFIPDLTGRNSHCDNHINDVCTIIEKCVNHNIQKTLDVLEDDVTKLRSSMDEHINTDNAASSANIKARSYAWLLYTLALGMPILVFTILSPSTDKLYNIIAVVIVSLLMVALGYNLHRLKPRLSRTQRSKLIEYRKYIHDHLKPKTSSLYGDYLKQSS